MGRLKNGPFSGFTGKTGSLVGMRKNGKWLMASVRATATRPPSVLQLNQQMKFGLITSWLSWIATYVDIGFQSYDAEMSPMNAAVRYNLKHAVTGTAPDYMVDYPKVLLSRGRLAPPYNFAVLPAEGSVLDFSWQPPVGSGSFEGTDKGAFMVYNPEKDLFIMQIDAAARSAGEYSMQLPTDFATDTVHCYMGFVSTDGKMVSNSSYLSSTVL